MTLMAREPFSLRLRRAGILTLFALLFVGIAALALGSIAYLLQPGWSDAAAPVDSPPLPIVVAGVLFNVPPAAIRIPLQRRAGPQERIDLAYRWPDLTPPDSHSADLSARLFVAIEISQASMPPAERLKSVYPRYIDAPPDSDPGGLTIEAFADGTPYQGEDVIYDASAPDRFLVRCNRARSDLTLAMCLYERPFGDAALTFRFPRDWLADWRAVATGIDRLIAQWRPAGT
jgi:hypothetical protein